jgi:hypothetical protein
VLRFFIFLLVAILILCVGGPQELTASRIVVVKSFGAAQFGREQSRPTADELKTERDRTKRLNEDRQKRLKEDTDRLLKLATELKEYVDKTNQNILSLDVIKKTEEIEKLAKSVREKMKTAYGTPEEPRGR